MKSVILKIFKNKNNKQVSGVFCKKELSESVKSLLAKKKFLKIYLEDS